MGPLFWLYITIALYLGMFLLVPVKKIKDYFSAGIYFGIFLALLIMFVGSTLFKLWATQNMLINVAGFEFTLALDWFPPVIIFCHYIKYFSKNWYTLVIYIMLFAAGSTIQKNILTYYGYWVDLNWNSFATFILGVISHVIIANYLILRNHIPRPGKTKI